MCYLGIVYTILLVQCDCLCVIYVFFLMIRRPPRSTRTDTLFPYTTLFRSARTGSCRTARGSRAAVPRRGGPGQNQPRVRSSMIVGDLDVMGVAVPPPRTDPPLVVDPDAVRSEERRVGKECVSTCSSRGSQNH